jgi:hypothetical protein
VVVTCCHEVFVSFLPIGNFLGVGTPPHAKLTLKLRSTTLSVIFTINYDKHITIYAIAFYALLQRAIMVFFNVLSSLAHFTMSFLKITTFAHNGPILEIKEYRVPVTVFHWAIM